jgi:hypothetical protein
MKMSVRVVFGAALLSACTSAPVALDRPLVVAFDWQPASVDVQLAPAAQKELAQRHEALRVFFENQFDSRFGDVTFVPAHATAAHADRVELTVAEIARQRVDAQPSPHRAELHGPDPTAVAQRCGSVEYVVYVANRESYRTSFPLNCTSRPDSLPGTYDRTFADQRGYADYEQAAARAATEIARAVRATS